MLVGILGRLKHRRITRVAGVYAVTGYAVFQIANSLLPALALPGWTVSLVAALFVLGFPIVVALSLALERNDGASGSIGSQQPDSTSRGWIDWAILGAACFVVVLAVVQSLGLERTTSATESAGVGPARSIAVLPFASFDELPDADYFADGLTEELINSLARLPDLKVAGRTSAFYFKDRNEDLREIGRKLGVAHVLEGSVRRAGDRLRITAQLIHVTDGFHLWSETYDRTLDDVFATQTQIARAVADALEARLLGAPAADSPRRDPRAYELELVARSRLRKQELAELQTARALYEQLVAMEPSNPSAHVGLAEATIYLAQSHLALEFDRARRDSEAAIDRALELAPASAEAWRVRGLLYRVLAIRTGLAASAATARQSFQRAVELDPENSDALAMLGAQLLADGRPEQAISLLQRALEIDPLSRLAQQQLGAGLAAQGRFGEARRQYESLIELYPDFTAAPIALAQLLIEQGRLDEAVERLDDEALMQDDPLAALLLAHCYVNLGMTTEMRSTLERIREPATAAALARLVLLQREGKIAELRQLAIEQHRASADPLWQSVQLSSAVLLDDEAAMREALAALAPNALAEPTALAAGSAIDAILAAHAMRRSGNPTQARALLEALLMRFDAGPDEYVPAITRWYRALAHSSLGDTDAAIAELLAAHDQGFRTLIDFDYFAAIDEYPFMAKLVQDPRFIELESRIVAENQRLRDALLARKR